MFISQTFINSVEAVDLLSPLSPSSSTSSTSTLCDAPPAKDLVYAEPEPFIQSATTPFHRLSYDSVAFSLRPPKRTIRRSKSIASHIIDERTTNCPSHTTRSAKLPCSEWNRKTHYPTPVFRGCAPRITPLRSLSVAPPQDDVLVLKVQPPSNFTPQRTPYDLRSYSPFKTQLLYKTTSTFQPYPPSTARSPQTAYTAVTPANIPYEVYISRAQAPRVSSQPLQLPLACTRTPLYLPSGRGQARSFELCRIAASIHEDGPSPPPSLISARISSSGSRPTSKSHPLRIETGVLSDVDVRRMRTMKKCMVMPRRDIGLGIFM